MELPLARTHLTRTSRIRRAWTVLMMIYCSLWSVQAFLLPPLRLPLRITGGMRSYAQQKDETERRPPSGTELAYSMTNASSSSALRNGTLTTTPSGWISVDNLKELKQSIDIVSVIESYGLNRFKRKGSDRATALCPFHKDRNPSLNIDGQRGIYKCFACGAGGDVFQFVKAYSALQGKDLSYYQAIREVTGQQLRGDGLSDEQRQERKRQKERTLLANAHAATFYIQCLTEPFGGAARQHLQSRGVSGATARMFALGFAPNVYYGHHRKSPWGTGSLVHHLKGLNFTAQEILDSGLAIRTKGRSKGDVVSGRDGREDAKATNRTDLVSYDELMDRFRDRLVVPIFDVSGKNVVGFGGRVLPALASEVEEQSDYPAPKYLNSPESPVFQKKNILFGEHLARDAIRKASRTDLGETSAPLIIVEGYMDAIALWQAGIKEVVASMGTALSSEQLSSAARTAGRGGRFVLCLDNDEAGKAALERVCSNGMLSDTVKSTSVEIAIATLPDEIKDPADFIESRGSSKAKELGSAADLFRSQVLKSAIDWTDWYIQRLFDGYDSTVPSGRPGSFSDMFERVAEFLARSFPPADRTRRAYEVAGSLAAIMAREKNETEVSNAVRNQLESDLVDSAARHAEAKDALQRRSESVNGYSEMSSQSALSSLSRGHGPRSAPEKEAKLARVTGKRAWNTSSVGDTAQFPSPLIKRRVSSSRKRERMRRPAKRVPKEKPLTPYFDGFDFASQSDIDWLGIPEEKRKRRITDLTLGYVPPAFRKPDTQYDPEGASDSFGLGQKTLPREKPVYFNSNDFHGRRFLTEEAMSAGYSGRVAKRDRSLLEKGIGSLVEQDIARMALEAEDAMLRTLVSHRAARTTVKNMLQARSAVGTDPGIEWSSAEKEWLFSSLVEGLDTIPRDCNTSDQLHAFLSGLSDAPAKAFGKLDPTASSAALADTFAEYTSMEEEETLGSTEPTNIQTIDQVSSSQYTDDDVVADVVAEDDLSVSVNGHSHVSVEGAVNEDIMEQVAERNSTFHQEDIVPQAHSAMNASQLQVAFVVDADCGQLDHYFQGDGGVNPFSNTDSSPDKEMRVELLVQELLSTLLWTNTARKANGLQHQLLDTFQSLQRLSPSETPTEESSSSNVTSTVTNNSPGSDPLDDLDVKSAEVAERYHSLAGELHHTMKSLQRLQDSAKRIGARVVGSGGLVSPDELARQQELEASLDEHLQDLSLTTSEAAVEADPPDGEEPYKDRMVRIEEEWGDWLGDDYEGTADDVKQEQATASMSRADRGLPLADLDDEDAGESIEEFNERIKREWGDWDV